jgi:predicted nucleic acid-binding protein
MILLDTNVLIYAFDLDSPFCKWARETIVGAVAGDGAAINAVSLAEICVGDADAPTVADRIRSWGVEILDVPAAAADVCASAYRQYRKRRMFPSDTPVPNLPNVPLPDFFIGAHAKTMGWELATTDQSRFHIYFPSVSLKMPR